MDSDHLDPLPPQFETRGRKMKTACEKALHDFSMFLIVHISMLWSCDYVIQYILIE